MIKSLVKATIFSVLVLLFLSVFREWTGDTLSDITCILPIGGFFLGYNISGIFNKTLYKKSILITSSKKTIIFLFSIILFCGILYGEYEVSYNNDYFNLDENIKEEILDTDYSFIEYLNHQKDFGSFYINDYKRLNDNSISITISRIRFYLNIVFMIIGILAYNTTYDDYKYCNVCGIYYKKRSIMSLNSDAFNKLNKMRDDIEISPNKIIDYVKKNPVLTVESKKSNEDIEVELNYCEECYCSFLSFKLSVLMGKKRKKTKLKPNIELNHSQAINQIVKLLDQ